jgi:hypothetical protein
VSQPRVDSLSVPDCVSLRQADSSPARSRVTLYLANPFGSRIPLPSVSAPAWVSIGDPMPRTRIELIRRSSLPRHVNRLARFLVPGLRPRQRELRALRPLSWDACRGDPDHGAAWRLPDRWPGTPAILQVALPVTAVFAGWLFFQPSARTQAVLSDVEGREANPDFLRRWLVLSPAESTFIERQIGVYLFVLAATWGCRSSWTTCGPLRGSAGSGRFAAPRRGGRRSGRPAWHVRGCRPSRQEQGDADPGVQEPRLRGFHLLSVLDRLWTPGFRLSLKPKA